MIHLDPKHEQIIRTILKNYPYTFYAFGSRVKGTQRRFSDLDLLYTEEIPKQELSQLRGEFEESNLPFTIDLVDWKNCSPEFRKTIEKELLLFTAPTAN